MVRAAGSGSPATTLSFASLERTLDRTIESLMKGEASSESRGLLIEARRLRSVVANWCSIPPPSDVYDEMLDRVLHLSTSAGASLYEPTPDSLRTEFDPMLRTDFDPRPLGDFEHDLRSERDPRGAAIHAPSRPAAEDDGPTALQQDYSAVVRAAAIPLASHSTVEPTGKRRNQTAAPTLQESVEFTAKRRNQTAAPTLHEGDGPTLRSNEEARNRARAEAFPPGPLPPTPAVVPAPPPMRSALGSSTGMRPAEPLPLRSTTSAARGRTLTRAPLPSTSEASSRASLVDDDPPSYPSFDSPAYPEEPAYPDDEAPSYPAYSLNEPTRHLPNEAIKARYHAEQQQQQQRTASYPPVRATSDPALVRPLYPAPITGDRLRVQSSPEMQIDAAPVADDAPIAPSTSVTVHIVKLSEKIDPHIVMLSDAYSDRADAYRALRRKLASSGNPQVIAVTSPDIGEGKTTCAVNLALAMRETSRGKVLLVEANGRSPSLAKLFGFETPECFGEQLLRRKEDPLKPWVAAEPLPKLHIMAMDPKIKRAPQLDPLAFSNGMERLKRAGYEYIILDTPPVLGTFEVNMIADNAEGVLFTAITMKSKRSHLRKAIEQIMPAPVLGVMVLDS